MAVIRCEQCNNQIDLDYDVECYDANNEPYCKKCRYVYGYWNDEYGIKGEDNEKNI